MDDLSYAAWPIGSGQPCLYRLQQEGQERVPSIDSSCFGCPSSRGCIALKVFVSGANDDTAARSRCGWRLNRCLKPSVRASAPLPPCKIDQLHPLRACLRSHPAWCANGLETSACKWQFLAMNHLSLCQSLRARHRVGGKDSCTEAKDGCKAAVKASSCLPMLNIHSKHAHWHRSESAHVMWIMKTRSKTCHQQNCFDGKAPQGAMGDLKLLFCCACPSSDVIAACGMLHRQMHKTSRMMW